MDVAEVDVDDDFFVLGGDFIIVVYVVYKLGIDMRSLYMFLIFIKFYKVFMEKEGIVKVDS